MDETQFFNIDVSKLKESKRKILMNAYMLHIQSQDQLTRADALHGAELRSLLMFLLTLVFFLTFNLKLETACLTWVGVQFLFLVFSKMSQFYHRFEVQRTKQNVESIIKTIGIDE